MNKYVTQNLKKKAFATKRFTNAEYAMLKELVRQTLKMFYAGDRDKFHSIFLKTWNELHSMNEEKGDFYMKKVLKGITSY